MTLRTKQIAFQCGGRGGVRAPRAGVASLYLTNIRGLTLRRALHRHKLCSIRCGPPPRRTEVCAQYGKDCKILGTSACESRVRALAQLASRQCCGIARACVTSIQKCPGQGKQTWMVCSVGVEGSHAMTRCWYASNSPARIIRQPIRRCAPPATRFPSVKLPETRTSYDAVLVETEQERRTTRPRGAFFSENARLNLQRRCGGEIALHKPSVSNPILAEGNLPH